MSRAALYLANFHSGSNFNNLRKAAARGGCHKKILQWSALLWTGNLGEQF
jgi:hypothetical protein